MGLSQNDYQELVGALGGKEKQDVAIVSDDPTMQKPSTIYYALGDAGALQPRSPVVDLIQALNERSEDCYGTLVKSKTIYHTGQASRMDKEMAGMNKLKLKSLKRKTVKWDQLVDDVPEQFEEVTVEEAPMDRWMWHSSLGEFPSLPLGPAPNVLVGTSSTELTSKVIDRLYMLSLYSMLIGRLGRLGTIRLLGGRRDTKGGNVGAVLVSRDGRILAWGLNTKSTNSTNHAEVNCLQSYWWWKRKKVPSGARIFTTLKPCRMCAGMIKHFGDGGITVIYGQDDTGPDAKKTVLKEGEDSWFLGQGGLSNPIRIEWGGKKNVPLSTVLTKIRSKSSSKPIVDTLGSGRSVDAMSIAVMLLLDSTEHYSSVKENKLEKRKDIQAARVLAHMKPWLDRYGGTLNHLIDLL